MKKIIKSPLIALSGVIALGFFLRIYEVSSVPPSLNWDEVSHGYNAFSILMTGKDEWGVPFPVIFRAYGDYKLPVYIYLTVASEFFFGLSALAVRLPSILAGTLTILFTYLVSSRFLNKNTSLLAALLVAVSPWSLFLSRAALEANVALFLIVAGVLLFILSLDKHKFFLPFSILPLGLSVWAYNSARIFVPLLIVAVAFIYRHEIFKFKKQRLALFISAGIFLVFFVPMFGQLLNSQGQARYINVRILDDGATARINELRSETHLPPVIERAIYNKATYFAGTFATNYVRHFMPDFLFLKGSDNYQFNVPGKGLVFAINLPFFVLGLVNALKNRQNKFLKLLLAWLFLSPIAASLTRESPHALRSIVMLVPVLVFIAQGFTVFQTKFKNGLWAMVYLIIIFLSTADYFHYYLTAYRQNYSWSWQFGYKQIMELVERDYQKYEKIVITKKYGEPHEFLLFYTKYDPEKFRTDPHLSRYFQSNWYWVDKFDKFYFVNDWEIPSIGSEFVLENKEVFSCASCLLVTSPGNAPEGWRKLTTIYFLDGKEAFEIYEH